MGVAGTPSPSFPPEVIGVLKKDGLFTVRLTIRGGEGSAPSALAVIKCESFDPFLALKFDSLILRNTFHLIVGGLIFHVF